MRHAWNAAKETIVASQEGQKAQYDKGTRPTQLKEGDLVLKKEHRLQGHGDKFKPQYEGVYRINKMSLTDAWIVPYGQPEEQEFKVHLNYLRKFEGTHVPPVDLKIRLKMRGKTEPTEYNPLGNVDAELAAVELHNKIQMTEDSPTGEEFVYDEEGRWVEWREVNEIWCDDCGKKFRWEEVGIFEEPQDNSYSCPECRKLPFQDDLITIECGEHRVGLT